MGRMTQYLRQTVSLERVKQTNGKPTMNMYGGLEYDAASTIRCRREKLIRDVEMPNGATTKSSTQYYTDVEIGMNDRLDGEVVLFVEEYTNAVGKAEGYRSIV